MSSVRDWLDLAEGPLFRFAFMVMVLGLIRLVIINVINIWKMRQRTPDKSTNTGALFLTSVTWMNPAKWLKEGRPYYTILSIFFHFGLIVLPIFYLPHITLWRPPVFFDWFPSIPTTMADALTLWTVITGIGLVLLRASNKGSREMSKTQDWVFTPLFVALFVSGYLAAHPVHNPIDYNSVRLVHVLVGDFLIVIIPFTKLTHIVLLPFTHVLTDFSWKLVPGVGEKVRMKLGHQDRAI